MKEKIRIASGQGFWGDLPRAPVDQIRGGPVDYLVMDYLAEVTLSIMHKQRTRNPEHGYAHDFTGMLDKMLPEVHSKGIKIISSAGGANPGGCKDAIVGLARKHQLPGMKIAVVDGDDILGQIDRLLEEGHQLSNMETGEPLRQVKERLLSANVYFGARPIVEALQQGADIVVTGRVTDSALTLAPLIYEFRWSFDDYNCLSAGTVAGHILECGAQATGGNFTDWESVDRLEDIGFPVIEAFPDGTLHVTKHEGTGGLVNEMTLKEQLLYEIGDPAKYITPDVVADFTTVRLRQIGDDKVELTGIKGYPDTPCYKISASYFDGYKVTSSLVYCWPEAVKKALAGAQILKRRASALGITLDDFRAELVGVNACDENPGRLNAVVEQTSEVELRISARGPDKDELDRFGKEIVSLILTGPGGVTGYAGGRPKASELVAYWPALLDKKACRPTTNVYET